MHCTKCIQTFSSSCERREGRSMEEKRMKREGLMKELGGEGSKGDDVKRKEGV